MYFYFKRQVHLKKVWYLYLNMQNKSSDTYLKTNPTRGNWYQKYITKILDQNIVTIIRVFYLYISSVKYGDIKWNSRHTVERGVQADAKLIQCATWADFTRAQFKCKSADVGRRNETLCWHLTNLIRHSALMPAPARVRKFLPRS